MFFILILLIVLDLVVFGVAATQGVRLESAGSLSEHFLWGVLATLLFCFTHILCLFYLIGSEADVKEALAGHSELQEKYVPWAKSLKRQVFPWASLAALLMVVATILGAHVHSDLLMKGLHEGRPADPPPLRGVGGWWIHLAFVVVAFASSLVAFYVELRAARENRRGIAEINALLEHHSPIVARIEKSD